MTITQVQSKVTKTSGFTGAGLDISGITNDWTICLQVAALSPAGAVATFAFEDTVNDFTAAIAGPVFSIQGTLTASNDSVHKVKKYMFPHVRFGTTSAQLRLVLKELTGSSPSVTYSAWIEY